MEESEKRRERLRAMRMEASSQDNSTPNSETDPNLQVLSNPLNETTASQEPCAASRFDFYTDPMAAFSGNKRPTSVVHTPNKRPSGISDQNMHGGFRPGGDGSGNAMVRLPPPPPPLGPRYPVNSPYPHQQHTHSTPNMATYQPGYHHYGPGPIRSPSPMMGPPYPVHQSPGPCNDPFLYHPPRAYNNPVTGQYLNPHGPNPAGPRQSYGWAQSPNVGRGQGQWVDHRGGGHQWGRGRGHYQGGNASRRLYDKSMVEDPWKHLEPVVWATNLRGKAPHAFQRSSDSKKPKVVEVSNTSKQSLADYLASAFNDTVEETGTGGDPVT